MVLREEFFPFMEEVKSSVAAMIKGANGSPLYTRRASSRPPSCILTRISSISLSPQELLDCDDLHSVIRLVLKAGNYMNSVGLSPAELLFYPLEALSFCP